MGVFNQDSDLRKVVDKLQSGIKGSSTIGAVLRTATSYLRLVETLVLREETTEIDAKDVSIQRYYSGDKNNPRPYDIVAGRWFVTPFIADLFPDGFYLDDDVFFLDDDYLALN